ncbi:MAG: hypothetical protein IJN13_04355 [Bacilli bacterium]|nr:hypothetical protein [Bacilli bacterium]
MQKGTTCYVLVGFKRSFKTPLAVFDNMASLNDYLVKHRIKCYRVHTVQYL